MLQVDDDIRCGYEEDTRRKIALIVEPAVRNEIANRSLGLDEMVVNNSIKELALVDLWWCQASRYTGGRTNFFFFLIYRRWYWK